ncbi:MULTISPECIES: chemotaxis protein CheB [unclassified Mucilaginibacter]|uniref:chemotaxis protein CheB n=1 Tax=unclassified Mucilaginibacter TaxID=2617802 RepID=UPI0031F72228
MSEIKSIVVVGASAGGFHAIGELISNMPQKLDLAVFVVLHMGRNSMADVLVQYIQKKTALTCELAENNKPIQSGHVYVAPPDIQTVVKKGTMRLIKGPHENRWRPSIDVLFRSAAAYYDSHAIGIVLTGLLDDGTSGMAAIKRSGGKCIVQEPLEAEFADMPINVLNNVEVDHRVPIADMGYVLQDILSKMPADSLHEIPEDVRIEAEITERRMSSMEELEKIGTRSNYSCPDCGGGLYEIKNDVITRFRCYTGHVYTGNLLLEKQSEGLEDSIWVSIRMLEERKNLLMRMANQNGNEVGGEGSKKEKARELGEHIERLKSLLVSINKNSGTTGGYE